MERLLGLEPLGMQGKARPLRETMREVRDCGGAADVQVDAVKTSVELVEAWGTAGAGLPSRGC